jgi:hypothetical protein
MGVNMKADVEILGGGVARYAFPYTERAEEWMRLVKEGCFTREGALVLHRDEVEDFVRIWTAQGYFVKVTLPGGERWRKK